MKLLTFIIGFGGIPGLVTFLVKKLVLDTKKDINVAFWCALIAAGTLIVLLLIYFAIYSKTKLKHMDAMTQARSIRDKMIANKKQANAIRHSIEAKDNWYQLILRMYQLDAGVRQTFFRNFIVNASLKGSATQEKVSEENACNVPWAILLDPTRACNLHCTG